MDSVPKIVNTMSLAAREVGIVPAQESAVKNIIGLSLPLAIKTLFPEHPQLHDSLTAQYKHQYKYVDNTPTPLFAAVKETLESLVAQGKTLAVATGKSRAGLERLLDETKLRSLFSFTRTSCEARSKPDPDMLLQILDYFDANADDALMIGDTQIDMCLGANAAIDTIGVTFGVHSASALAKYSPVATVDSYQELANLLEG